MRVPSIVASIAVIALVAALACGPKTATVQTPSPPPSDTTSFDQCHFFPSTASLADTIVVALFDPVDPAHAPEWRNESERLVFHHLYESVNLIPNCDTGLLVEAHVSDDGLVASLRLRDDARFWDGTPVTAHDVAETLENARAFTEGIDSITTPDDRTIDIHVAVRGFEWKALQSPTLAITKRSADIWPMGTGPYQIVDSGIRDRVLTMRPSFDSKKPVLQYFDARGIDPRNVLDPGFSPRIDLTFVDDPNLVEYATGQNRFHAMELRESKAYFLLSVTRVPALETSESIATFPDSVKQAMADDAVRNASAYPLATSRGVLGGCDPLTGGNPTATVPPTRRILYDASDPTARDLADRVVALATTTSRFVTVLWAAIPGINSASPRAAAVGVSAAEFATSLASGSDFAYVVALPLGHPESCFLPRELIRMAPWLGMGRAPLHLKTIPLVSTAPYAVAARSETGASFALSMDVVGNISIVGTRRKETP